MPNIKSDIRNEKTPRFWQWAFVLCLILTFASCHSLRNVAENEHPAPDTQTAPTPNCPYLYLSAPFDCSVSGTTVHGVLRAQCDSAIWLSVSKFIELGRAKFTADSVKVLVKINGTYFSGTYDDVRSATGCEVTFEQLQQLLSDTYTEHTYSSATLDIPIGRLLPVEKLQLQIRRFDTPSIPLQFPLVIPASASPLIQ